MQLFPEKIRELWSNWEVRVLIQLSLVLQIILIIFGSRRKFTRRSWIRILVWLTYLSADWVATVALGNLAGSQEDSGPKNVLQAFWAPFLLLHLGGPDTITAYSLEDNELWLRHLLGLVVQVVGALYVFILSWSNTPLTFITIVMFISGIIKYGERTFVLKSSSSQNFKDSLPSTPDPCPDYVKFVGQDSTRGKRLEGSSSPTEVIVVPQEGINPEDHYFVQAYFLFKRLEYHFAEVILRSNDRMQVYSIIGDISTEEAFKMVAVELGFMYDVLYTKATIVYSLLGICLRCVSFFCSVSALILFSIIIDVHTYPFIYMYVTYLLLVGAVLLEIYAFIVLIYSDWTKLWLIKLKKAQHNMISKALVDNFWKFITFFGSLSCTHRKRWSESMGQYNLISSCLKKVQPTWIGVLHKLPWIGELLEKYGCLTWEDANIDDLQETIFRYLKEQGHTVNADNSSYGLRDLVLAQRGDFALQKRYHFGGEFHWCTIGIEFVDSLVIWHLATDICYYADLDSIGDVNDLRPKCKISKCLSDYMFYLLVFCPSMLPKGIGEIRYTGTRDELISFFKEKRGDIANESNKACKALLEKYPQQRKSKLQGDFEFSLVGETQSLLKYGCLLSSQLQEKESHDHHQRKWEIISDVWVEMLAYAAHSCGWQEHCQRLKEGGEMLTHVCLLMAHFGLSKQYVQDTLVQLTPQVMAAEILKEEEKVKLPFRRW